MKYFFSRCSKLAAFFWVVFFVFASLAKGQAPNISYPSNTYSFPLGKPIASLSPTNSGGTVGYGLVSTLAGKRPDQDGTGVNACFYTPTGVAVDGSGNVYVADDGNNRIRKVSPSGVVSTLAGSGSQGSADGTGSAASFYSPFGVAVDGSGNVYVADKWNNKIRKVSPSGVVSTLAGSGSIGSSDGTGSAASFNQPTGVAVDGSGNVYVADIGNKLIRKVSPSGVVSTLAGSGSYGSADGTGSAASFYDPTGVAIDGSGNVYVADQYNNNIRKVSPSGVVSTLAGSGSWGSSDGTGSAASFTSPTGVAVDGSGNVYVADAGNNKIRKVSPSGVVSSLAGSGSQGSSDGTGSAASFYHPSGVAVDGSGNVYVADADNNKIRKVSPSGVVSTLAGSGSSGSTDGTGSSASFNGPCGVAVDGSGNVYVADHYNHKIRKVSPSGVVSTLAGSGSIGSADGTGGDASFFFPYGVAVDGSGNVYVADADNNKIRKVSPSGVVSTLAGSGGYGSADGTGSAASFNRPYGVAVDGSGNVYVADGGNNTIRKVSPSGVVSTLAGSGSWGSSDGTGGAASFNQPTGVAVDGSGNVYVADQNNNKIRKVSPSGVVSTLAGSGISGSSDGTGSDASFYYPNGVAVDGSGNVYVADYNNNLIRKITLGYTISPALPSGLSFDPTTGIISGSTTEITAQKVYTVTATNSFGTSTYSITIAIVAPTPVTISSFSAIAIANHQINTQWQTATELNTDHFNIERSIDGINFNAIGKVSAVGSGANSYQFTDLAPLNGVNHYRLQSVDKDGSFSYSKIVFVSITNYELPITVYPNPATSSVIVKGSHIAKIQVVDNLGRVVGNHSLSDANNPSINVGSLSAGAYHLRVRTTDGKVNSVEFIKK